MHAWKHLEVFLWKSLKGKIMFFFSSEPRQLSPEESYRLIGDALHYSEEEREELELKLKRSNIFIALYRIFGNRN